MKDEEMTSEDQKDPDRTPTLTRRGILAAGGAAILGAAGGFAVARATTAAPAANESVVAEASTATTAPTLPAASPSPTVTNGALPARQLLPFYGRNQAGIETAPALFQAFVGLDLVKARRRNVEAVLRLITDDAARLTQGEPTLGDAQPDLALNADLLSITVGVGHSLLASIGLSDQVPSRFPKIPGFANDALEKPWGSTDLVLQVAANDPVTLSHTIRMLTKDLSTLTTIAWIQRGFLSSAAADLGEGAKRNLMGQPEGNHFPAPGTPQFASVVWIDDGPAWVRGGTILVLRRMRMLFDTWDKLDKDAQELAIGRRQSDGAPLGSDDPEAPLDFNAVDDFGLPAIPTDAHVRVAAASSLDGVIMRRPYNYDDLLADGRQDRGLLFAAYTADSSKSFIPTQQRLTKADIFQKWISAVGSATYLILPGAQEGDYLGSGLLT